MTTPTPGMSHTLGDRIPFGGSSPINSEATKPDPADREPTITLGVASFPGTYALPLQRGDRRCCKFPPQSVVLSGSECGCRERKAGAVSNREGWRERIRGAGQVPFVEVPLAWFTRFSKH
jgi:hypothetical protein